MSYRITYGTKPFKTSPPIPKWLPALGAAVIIAAALRLLDPQLSFLLPGDAAVTGPALEAMLRQLAGGADAVEAFGEFCREVVHGAGAY